MAKTPKKDAKAKAADDATIDESNLNISVEGEAPAPDAPNTADATDAAPQATGEPMLTVLAQYTRDMSFENPNAPASLKSGQAQPEVSIDLRIGRQISDDNTIEISILVKAHAMRGDQTVFLAELDYAGLFAIKNVGLEQMQPLMMIECPRLLFPYARKILADMTQDGGHLPIMMDMPDFASMYREEMMRRGQEQSLN
jgi:preprotein translocase subunit SecB